MSENAHDIAVKVLKGRRGRKKKVIPPPLNSPEVPNADRIVTMSNYLIRAGDNLTLSEKRLVALGLSKINSLERVRQGYVPTTKIYASDYSETYGVDIDVAYAQLQAAADKLFSRMIIGYEPAWKRNGDPIERTRVKLRWVGKAHYFKGEAMVELSWFPEIITHITGLQGHFTSIKLQQTSALRSSYSWKLLQLLMRFETTGWCEYSIEDFCESMSAPPSVRNDFGQIKRRIIVPAVTELVEKHNWRIDWKPLKKGRKTRAIYFNFERSTQQRLPF